MPGQPRASGWAPRTPLQAPFAFSFEPLGTLRGDSSPAWGPQSCGFGATMSRQGSPSLFSEALPPLLPPEAADSRGPGRVSESGWVHMLPCVCAPNANISCLALYGKSVLTPGPGCGPHRCRTALTLVSKGWQGSILLRISYPLIIFRKFGNQVLNLELSYLIFFLILFFSLS